MTDKPTVYVIRVIGRASGEPSREDGHYVQDLDADAHQGRGHVTWANNAYHAKHFPDTDSALAYYHTQSKKYPTRPDGQPNKPLTAYTVDIMPVFLPTPQLDTTMRVHQLIQQVLSRGGMFAHPAMVPMVPTLLRDLRQAVYYSTDIEPETLPQFHDDVMPLPFLTLPYKLMYIEVPVQMGMSRTKTGAVDIMSGKIAHLCSQTEEGGIRVALFTYAENLWSLAGLAEVHPDGKVEYQEAIPIRPAIAPKHYQYLRQSLEYLLRFLDALYTHENTVVEVTGPSKAARKKAAKQGKTLKGIPIAYKRVTIHLDQPKLRVVQPKTDKGGTHASPIEHPRDGHWAYRRNPDGTVKRREDGSEIKWWVRGCTVNKGKTVIREEKEIFVTH